MSGVPDIHDVLHWSNRTLVAEEITQRGFRVSKETLNRWVRQRKEVPAAVERIVFDMFGISPDTAKEPPPWAEVMESRVLEAVERSRVESLPERVAEQLAVQLGLAQSPGGEDAHEGNGELLDSAGTARPPKE